MRVYLDLVILLNFLVDYLLLLGTNRISGFPLTPGRTALAAVLGGIYFGGRSAWGVWGLFLSDCVREPFVGVYCLH